MLKSIVSGRSRSSRRTLGASTVGVLAIVGAGALSAAAVASPPAGSAIERVSLADTGGSAAFQYTGGRNAIIGDDVAVWGNGADPQGDLPSGAAASFTSERLASGWQSAANVPMSPLYASRYVEATDGTRDLSAMIFTVSDTITFSTPGPEQSEPVRLEYRSADGTFRTIVRDDGPSGRTGLTHYNGLSANGERVVYTSDHSPQGLPDTEGTSKVYAWNANDGSVARLTDAVPELEDCAVDGSVGTPLSVGVGNEANSVSADGRYVFVRVTGGGAGCDVGTLWRIGPDGAVQIATPAGSDLVGAASDGSSAFVLTNPAGTSNRTDLYYWSAAEGPSCLTCADGGFGVASFGTPRQASEFPRATPDGRSLFFDAVGPIGGVGDANVRNAFVARDGVVRLVRANSYVEDGSFSTSPDGRVAIVKSAADGALYRVTVADGTASCLSCDGTGAPHGAQIGMANGLIGTRTSSAAGIAGVPPAVSDDGRTVAFYSSAQLTGEPVAGPTAYRWRAGVGTAVVGPSLPSVPPSVSPSGKSTFFFSDQGLTPDAEPVATLYVARDGGGFPPDQTSPAPCIGDTCQGATSPIAPGPFPGSVADAATGNARPGTETDRSAPARPTLRVTALSAAARARAARTGTIKVRVRTTVKGRVSVKAQARISGRSRRVASSTVSVGRAPKSITVNLRLSTAAKRELARRGRLRVAVRVTQSRAKSRTTTVVLSRKAR